MRRCRRHCWKTTAALMRSRDVRTEECRNLRRIVEEISRNTPVSVSHVPWTADLIQFRNNPRKKKKRELAAARRDTIAWGRKKRTSAARVGNNTRTALYNKNSETERRTNAWHWLLMRARILSAGILLKISCSTERKFSSYVSDMISCFVFDEMLKIPRIFSKNRITKTENLTSS